MSSLFVNEKRMNDNIFLYEDRLSNPTTRFQEDTPTYVTYYHIDADETTVDAGFEDVASILGNRSPIRFTKTVEFPIYMSNEITPSLEDADQGMDSSFEGEAVILPATIKPLENDFFVIPYLHEQYVFRVVAIDYDNIKPDNYYKITFTLKSVDGGDIVKLEKQTIKSYTCITENIGTEKRCVIEDAIFEKIEKVTEMYRDMVSTYTSIFFNKRYNCFLGTEENGRLLYDPFQVKFINSHDLFNDKKSLSTIFLTEHCRDSKARIKYEKSVYRAFERRRLDVLNKFSYGVRSSKLVPESGFSAYNDSGIDILDIGQQYSDTHDIFSNEFIMAVEMNADLDNGYATLMQKYLRNEKMSIDDIPLNLMDELLALDANLEMFFFVPIVLYVIREVINEEMKSS